jgi:hypothetical protein
VWPELGFQFAINNGWQKSLSISLIARLVAFGASASNSCVISCSETTVPKNMLSILHQAQVAAFDPDDAIVNGGELLKLALSKARDAADRGEIGGILKYPAILRYTRGKGSSMNESQ